MPRFEAHQPLYEITAKFIRNCLRSDSSLLWPKKQLWTLKNLQEIKERFVDSEDPGKGTFEFKFKKQFSGVNSEVWGVLADIFYIYALPANSWRFETKQRFILFSAEQASYSLPDKDDALWLPLQKGFSHAGQQYSLKYPQLRFLILLACGIKSGKYKLPDPLSSDEFQSILDQVMQDTPAGYSYGFDMLYALRYMAFPEEFEPIISHRDQESIIKAFSAAMPGIVEQPLHLAIRQIRERLSSQYDKDGKPFHFYNPDVKLLWPISNSGNVKSPIPPGKDGKDKPEGNNTTLPAEVAKIQQILRFTSNLILYGPPGTGKTYLARKAAEAIVGQELEKPVSDEGLSLQVIDGLSAHEVAALAMYVSGKTKTFTVAELENLPLLKIRFQSRPVQNPRQSIWGFLQIHTSETSKTVNVARRASPSLFDKNKSSGWVLTPDGIEYVEQNLLERLDLLTKKAKPAITKDKFIQSITFHQSYSYEDFIEGFRPLANEAEDENARIGLVAGVFKRLCERAASDPDHTYVLIIDEINRGNIAKIMGEMITCIEHDKRTITENEFSPTLPYSGKRFFVPPNVLIMGTMNTSDRSIALLDVALRRRFAFFEIMPNPNLLKETKVTCDGTEVALDQLLAALNKVIAEQVDRDHQIGHSYLMRVQDVIKESKDGLAMLEFVWNYQIVPLLQEYYYSRTEELKDLLKDFPQHNLENPVIGKDLIVALSKFVN